MPRLVRMTGIIWLAILWASPALATDLDGWRLLQLSAAEQLAVFASPAGELQLAKAGDRLGERLVVTGFDNERVILERPGEWGRVTLFVSLLNGQQQIASRERQPLRKQEMTGTPAPP